MELFVRNQAKISLEFTDKSFILDDFSVSKTHFTDKPAFSNDLSVNFWQLWWGFTDKAGFLEHLSVKPGSKRLNFYGQTAIFDHFVRNLHFWSRPFTDRRLIFSDVSVSAELLPNAVPDKSARQNHGHVLLHGRISVIRFLIWGIFFGSLSNGVDDLENFTSEMEWSFFVPVGFSCFFQIGTVTYQHRLRFHWRGFMYEFLPLIRSAFELCESTVDVT